MPERLIISRIFAASFDNEYKTIYEQFYSLGWSEGINIDCQLPEEICCLTTFNCISRKQIAKNTRFGTTRDDACAVHIVVLFPGKFQHFVK